MRVQLTNIKDRECAKKQTYPIVNKLLLMTTF